MVSATVYAWLVGLLRPLSWAVHHAGEGSALSTGVSKGHGVLVAYLGDGRMFHAWLGDDESRVVVFCNGGSYGVRHGQSVVSYELADPLFFSLLLSELWACGLVVGSPPDR